MKPAQHKRRLFLYDLFFHPGFILASSWLHPRFILASCSLIFPNPALSSVPIAHLHRTHGVAEGELSRTSSEEEAKQESSTGVCNIHSFRSHAPEPKNYCCGGGQTFNVTINNKGRMPADSDIHRPFRGSEIYLLQKAFFDAGLVSPTPKFFKAN
jgi:hypothetical protein